MLGNFNNLIMLRVRETATAELLTKQLPKVDIASISPMSSATDSSDPHGGTAFTSSSMDRITTSVPLLVPAYIVALPKGQAYALLEGGTLWKLRMPLPVHEPDADMPTGLRTLAEHMRRQYSNDAPTWHGETDDHG